MAKAQSTNELFQEYLKELKNPISKNINKKYDEQLSIGDKLADHLTEFAGSWTFIILFITLIVAWIILNLTYLIYPFDPFPFILLNLFLSTLAAFQAPIIMMSQNRQAERDRLQSEFDYHVNLKSEAQIESLHRKIDYLKKDKWDELIKLQKEQIKILKELNGGSKSSSKSK